MRRSPRIVRIGSVCRSVPLLGDVHAPGLGAAGRAGGGADAGTCVRPVARQRSSPSGNASDSTARKARSFALAIRREA